MEEVVLKYSPNVLKGKKASFILHHLDDEDLNTFRNGNVKITKNALIVRGRRPRLRKNEFFMTSGNWKEEQEKYEEETRGCFVVIDNIMDSESEYYHRMERYNKYYPVVFVSFDHVSGEKEEMKSYLTSEIKGWRKRTAKNHGVTMYVNKNLSEFDSFVVNFKDILSPLEKGMKGEKSGKKGKPKALVSVEIPSNLEDEIFSSSSKMSSSSMMKESKPKAVTIRKPGKNKEADWSIFDGLPQPTMEPDHKSSTWIGEFYIYLKTIMTKIVPSNQTKLVDILVNKTTIQDYWLDIFTSEYHNPNTGENYETYEAVGDSVIKYIFYIYLYEKFGTTISKNQLNDLKAKHLSTGWQRILGEKMELDKWTLVPGILAGHAQLREDLSEAFTCGIEIILNKYARRGMSELVLLNMLNLLFRDYDFDLGEKMQKDLKPMETKLVQWYSEIGGSGEKMQKERITLKKPRSVSQKEWDTVKDDFEKILKKKGILIPVTEKAGNKEEGVTFKTVQNENGTYTVSVYLNEAGYKALKAKGIPVDKLSQNNFLAKATGREVKLVDKNAKIRAMEKLEEIGLTDEWRQKRNLEKNRKRVEGLEEALIKASSINKNIIEVVPKEIKRTKDFIIYQLHGIMKDGRTDVLETIYQDLSGQESFGKDNGFQELIDQYLKS